MNPIDKLRKVIEIYSKDNILKCFEKYNNIALNIDGSIDVFGYSILNIDKIMQHFKVSPNNFKIPFKIRYAEDIVFTRDFSIPKIRLKFESLENFPDNYCLTDRLWLIKDLI